MGITVPTGVTSISAPPVRKIIPNIIPPPNPKPHHVPAVQPYHIANVNANKTSFTNQKPKSNYNGPIITVFVGNINEKISDIVIRQILDVSFI